MTEKVLYDSLSYRDGVELLQKETTERININKTGWDTGGYNTKIPGYIVVPVKHSKDPEVRKEQRKEVLSLGYRELSEEEQKLYSLIYKGKALYRIPVATLMKIHKIGR